MYSSTLPSPDHVSVEETKTQSNVMSLPVVAADDTDRASEKLPASPEATQEGVRKVEAIALTWTKSSLVVAFACMFMLYFVNAFQSSITNNLTPYITSGFEEHSLLTVIYIVSNSMSAAVYIPVAKLLNVWGRAEGFLIMVCIATLGLALSAVTKDLPTFCAAQVFYSVGFGGMIYTIDVITADTSSLKHRGLAFAFTSSPYIITAFAGPKASEGFYENISWRWGYGCFAVILPFVATPLFIVLKYNLRKAKQQGLLKRGSSGRSLVQSMWHYTQEFDAVGMVLLAAGLVMFLLPFTLANSAPAGWGSGYIIAMLVAGFVLLITFGVYEKCVARQPFVPFVVLAHRSVVGACSLACTYQIAYYCWNSYFTSFLQVVTNLTIAEAGYITSTFDVVSGLLLLGVGLLIGKTGYFRWLLLIAVPIYVFAQGLMIRFRHPGAKVCYLIAALAAVDHQQVASVLALLNVIGWIGGAIGNTISGAIWTNSFFQALARLLPDDVQPRLDEIYGSLDVQLSFEHGSPTRMAIQQVYGIAQERMLIAGTTIMGLSLIWMFLIQNHNVAKLQQVKGVVF